MPLPNFSETTKDSFDNKNPYEMDSANSITLDQVAVRQGHPEDDTQKTVFKVPSTGEPISIGKNLIDIKGSSQQDYNDVSTDPAFLNPGEFRIPGYRGSADAVAQRIQQAESLKPAANFNDALLNPSKDYQVKSAAEALLLRQARIDSGLYKQQVTKAQKDAVDAAKKAKDNLDQLKVQPVKDLASSPLMAAFSGDEKTKNAFIAGQSSNYAAYQASVDADIKKRRDELARIRTPLNSKLLEDTRSSDESALAESKANPIKKLGAIREARIKQRAELDKWNEASDALSRERDQRLMMFLNRPDVQTFVKFQQDTAQLADKYGDRTAEHVNTETARRAGNAARDLDETAQRKGVPRGEQMSALIANGDGARLESTFKYSDSIVSAIGTERMRKAYDTLKTLAKESKAPSSSVKDAAERADGFSTASISKEGLYIADNSGSRDVLITALDNAGIEGDERAHVIKRFNVTERNQAAKAYDEELDKFIVNVNNEAASVIGDINKNMGQMDSDWVAYALSPERQAEKPTAVEIANRVRTKFIKELSSKMGVDETAISSIYGDLDTSNKALVDKANTNFYNILLNADIEKQSKLAMKRREDGARDEEMLLPDIGKDSGYLAVSSDPDGRYLLPQSPRDAEAKIEYFSKIANESKYVLEKMGVKTETLQKKDGSGSVVKFTMTPDAVQNMKYIKTIPIVPEYLKTYKDSILLAGMTLNNSDVASNPSANHEYITEKIGGINKVDDLVNNDPDQQAGGKPTDWPDWIEGAAEKSADVKMLLSAKGGAGSTGATLRRIGLYYAGEMAVKNAGEQLVNTKKRIEANSTMLMSDVAGKHGDEFALRMKLSIDKAGQDAPPGKKDEAEYQKTEEVIGKLEQIIQGEIDGPTAQLEVLRARLNNSFTKIGGIYADVKASRDTTGLAVDKETKSQLSPYVSDGYTAEKTSKLWMDFINKADKMIREKQLERTTLRYMEQQGRSLQNNPAIH